MFYMYIKKVPISDVKAAEKYKVLSIDTKVSANKVKY